MAGCKNFKALVTSYDENGNMLVARTRCKQWTCSYCATQLTKQWRARLIDFIKKTGGKWGWFTLTAKSTTRTAEKSLQNLRGVWDTLIKRMKRKYGKFHYCRVYEPHKDGAYHLHCIVSLNFDDIKYRQPRKRNEDGSKKKPVPYSQWLYDQAKDLKIGWYTHADNFGDSFHSGGIASYITKYVTKLTKKQKSEIGRVRHIQCSQGWDKLKKLSNGGWEMTSGIYQVDLDKMMDANKHIIDVTTGEKVTYDDFVDSYVYPEEFKVPDDFYYDKKRRQLVKVIE